MAAPFLADSAVCRWLLLKDDGAADAEVLRCPAALAAAHVHTIRRVADCVDNGGAPLVDWSGPDGGGSDGAFAARGGAPPSGVGGPLVADLRLVSRHINGFLVGLSMDAVLPSTPAGGGGGDGDGGGRRCGGGGGGGGDGDGSTFVGPTLKSLPRTRSRRWAAHSPAEGKVVLIEFGWMPDAAIAVVRLFTWSRGRSGCGGDASRPRISFQGTVLTHAGAQPGKLPPADVIARVSFNERPCRPCETLAAASAGGGHARAAGGAYARPGAQPHRGTGGVATIGGTSSRKVIELSRCTDEAPESALTDGAGSRSGGGSNLGRSRSSSGSYSLSSSATTSGVRSVGSSAPLPLSARDFVDFLASASVSCATLSTTDGPGGSGKAQSGTAATVALLPKWEEQKRSLVVDHSAVDWRTPDVVRPALRTLLTSLVNAAEVDRLMTEAASLSAAQGLRPPPPPAGDGAVAGAHDRPPRWEASAGVPPRPRYSPRMPDFRHPDGGGVTKTVVLTPSMAFREVAPAGAPWAAPAPVSPSPLRFPAYGLPRGSAPAATAGFPTPLQPVGVVPRPGAGQSPLPGVPVSPGPAVTPHLRRPSSLPPLLPMLSPPGAYDWRLAAAAAPPPAATVGATGHPSGSMPPSQPGSMRRLSLGASPGFCRPPAAVGLPSASGAPAPPTERSLTLPPSAMHRDAPQRDASPYGQPLSGGVPMSPMAPGVSPLPLTGMGLPPPASVPATISPLSVSPINPLSSGLARVPNQPRGGLPADGGVPMGGAYPPLPPGGSGPVGGGFKMRPSVAPGNALSPPAFVLPRVYWPTGGGGGGGTSGGLPPHAAAAPHGVLPPNGVPSSLGGVAPGAPGRALDGGGPTPVGHAGMVALAAASALGGGLPEPPLPRRGGEPPPPPPPPLLHATRGHPPPADEAGAVYRTAKRARVGAPAALSAPIPCDVCGRNFATRGDRNRHQRTVHEKARRHPCTVPGCSAAFSESSHVRTHMRTVHERRRDFVCDICNTALSTRSVLAKHKRNVHDDYRPYPCTLCDLRFSQRCDLVRHSRRAHSSNGPPSPDGGPAADPASGGGDGGPAGLLPAAARPGSLPTSAAPPRVF
ncbi:hypothetical protein BU14_1750s0001 [Porphyra umbilicalis]|uniref:C2H2-type domain-containing protein n=1 Tax=Porphyra umbilicalis TaxID=2786 RepID=A0A1X6NKT1_PORUM|nr:hypothetical protein BU14_1750s0001 [Porphyra umbilicalis]|eukprot:OSX69198.1 hypothetical protein BU14_1750s0001 [Porphyra umbilicalis]